MKISFRSFSILTLTILCLTTCARAVAADILTVAIFDFESKDEGVRGLGPKVAALVNVNLSTSPQIITVERAELEKLLGEQELGLSGTVSAETVAKVGNLTGAKVLVTGRVFKIADETLVVAKIIGTETSRVYGELVKGGANASIAELSAELAGKISTVVSEKRATLVARVETREDRVARIKKALGDKRLPTVSVRIPEVHFGQRVVDPAAETELGLILQQCGFKLIDASSTNRAEIIITGEAFSAFGVRKGNLISCKSRIELKAHKQNGDLITVDRQTGVAVDIAEQTAAKTALQNAAAEIAERLLSALVQ